MKYANFRKYALILIVILLLTKTTAVTPLWERYSTKQNHQYCSSISHMVINESTPRITVGILAGVHGNEPAGSVSVLRLLKNGYFHQKSQENAIKFVIIPAANKCGLQTNSRHQPFTAHSDINRNFGTEYGRGSVAPQILKLLKDCDLVVDLHEGWGWSSKKNGSVGSSLLPVDKPISIDISKKVVDAINESIDESHKKFNVLVDKPAPCGSSKTLRCWMQNNGNEYILVEVTGQNNIQPMEKRVLQFDFIIKNIIQLI